MIEISLTDFVDFAISSGTPKLTKVKNIKKRPAYQPAFDFWKQLREAIIDFHQSGDTDKNVLDQTLSSLSDPKKRNRYPDCIGGYKRFLGRKNPVWFEPPRNAWGPQGIRIRINPELGLVIDGVPHVIKLYFKKERLSKRRIEIILLLLHTALEEQVSRDTQFCILDVPRASLFATSSANSPLLPLLNGEAVNFITIWESI